MDESKRKYKKKFDELRFYKYVEVYCDAVTAFAAIERMIENGATVQQVQAKIKEWQVADDATWHIHTAEEKKLQQARAKELRAAKKKTE